jgi:iron complex transport system substrate-binding protein
MRCAARAILAAVLLAGPPAAAAPQRIVSANLCADRLVLALAPRAHIVSVSRFAADPALSPVAAQAAAIPVNRGDAEAILALRPDLAVLGAFGMRGTAALLRGVGVAVHEVPIVADLAAARAAILDLARRLEAAPAGAALVAAFDARLAALPRPAAPMRAVALHAGGWVAGHGTIADAVFAQLGLINAATEAGATGYVVRDAERLRVLSPALVAIEPVATATATGDITRHAIASARRIDIPPRDWACPDLALADAAARIAAAAR